MRIHDKVSQYKWSVETLKELQAELVPFLEKGITIPEVPGGWWHNYVCPSHHTELEFNPLEEDAHSFRCPHGCELHGEPYRGAWLVFKHQSLARFMLQSSAVYAATKDERFSVLAKNILIRYATQFPLYPVHPDAEPWMLKGRAFQQALTEAIWATTMLRGYALLIDEAVDFSTDAEVIGTFLTMLEESMVQYRHILVHEKNNIENNYTAWLNAALSCVYAIRGEKDKLCDLVTDEGGLIHHLTVGVKPDQFEFEGSVYYHIFVLRAYLIVAEMAERFGINLYATKGEQGQSFVGMFDVLVQLADRQGELPALHDGPFRRLPYTREIAEILEIGMSKYQNSEYLPLLAHVYRQLSKDGARRGLEALVFGTHDWCFEIENKQTSSFLFADSGFASLNHRGNPFSLIVDFGTHGGSHGHYDKLNVVINHTMGALAPELGMVPYGSAMREAWFRETASHNTVCVGGRSQQPHEGRYESFRITPEYSSVHIQSQHAYDDCVLERHVMLTEAIFIDWFEVTLEQEQEIDWWLHIPGGISVADDWIESSGQLGGDHAYDYVQSVVRLENKPVAGQADMLLHVSPSDMNSHQAVQVSMSTMLSPLSVIHKIKSPGNATDPSQKIDGIMHRQTTKNARFVTVFRDGNQPVVLESLGMHQEGEIIRISTEKERWSFILSPRGILKI